MNAIHRFFKTRSFSSISRRDVSPSPGGFLKNKVPIGSNGSSTATCLRLLNVPFEQKTFCFRKDDTLTKRIESTVRNGQLKTPRRRTIRARRLTDGARRWCWGFLSSPIFALRKPIILATSVTKTRQLSICCIIFSIVIALDIEPLRFLVSFYSVTQYTPAARVASFSESRSQRLRDRRHRRRRTSLYSYRPSFPLSFSICTFAS